jgi:ABC-type transport system involved in multi-copper enzyme maturation permease subunit
MIAGSLLVADLTVGEYEKILRDLGLASINLFGMVIAVFVGIGLVWKEIDRKTIYTIASKPVPRWQFLLGKYLGLAGTLAVEVAIMGIGFAIVLAFAGAEGAWHAIPAIWLTFVELLVVIAVAIVFSCFSSPTLSALFTIGLCVIGRLTASLRDFAMAGDDPAMQRFASVIYKLLPDLQTFNLRAEAAYGRAWDWEYVAYATGYGVVWATVLLVLATLIFQFRDFK